MSTLSPGQSEENWEPATGQNSHCRAHAVNTLLNETRRQTRGQLETMDGDNSARSFAVK